MLLYGDLLKSAIARKKKFARGQLAQLVGHDRGGSWNDRAGRWSPAQRVQATLLSIIGPRALTPLSGLVGRQIAGTVAFLYQHTRENLTTECRNRCRDCLLIAIHCPNRMARHYGRPRPYGGVVSILVQEKAE